MKHFHAIYRADRELVEIAIGTRKERAVIDTHPVP